jgi:hypothetical protein
MTSSLERKNTFAPPSVAFVKAYDYDAEGRMIYEGWAFSGASTSAAVWVIRKASYDVNGRLILEQWAGGNVNFVHVWDDRAALNYA